MSDAALVVTHCIWLCAVRLRYDERLRCERLRPCPSFSKIPGRERARENEGFANTHTLSVCTYSSSTGDPPTHTGLYWRVCLRSSTDSWRFTAVLYVAVFYSEARGREQPSVLVQTSTMFSQLVRSPTIIYTHMGENRHAPMRFYVFTLCM